MANYEYEYTVKKSVTLVGEIPDFVPGINLYGGDFRVIARVISMLHIRGSKNAIITMVSNVPLNELWANIPISICMDGGLLRYHFIRKIPDAVLAADDKERWWEPRIPLATLVEHPPCTCPGCPPPEWAPEWVSQTRYDI